MSEAGPGPGMGLDEKAEKKLEAATKKILEMLKDKEPDYRQIAADVARARKTANALRAMKEKTEPAPVDTPQLPRKAPVVCLKGVRADSVRARWKEQLWLRVKSVYEMLSGETVSKLPKWGEAISLDWRQKRDRTNRAKPTATAMREAHVFALLLAREPNVIRVTRGDVLFEDDFSEGADKWHLYGPCVTTRPKGGGLRRKNKRARHADTMIWTKPEFDGNFLFEFTYIANKGGRGPGTLFAICGRPVKKGTDLSVSCGETMGTYNHGVHAYHFSMHRGETNICNGRKVGTGLHLIGSRTPDPCPDENTPYRIAIGKWDDLVFCLADGKLQHVYYDAGTFGPALDGGSCGMRNWGGADATFQDVKVYRLVERDAAKE
ncbi:MAG: hypothetical protein R6V58_13040 [Planctomycetota bacterium]